MEHQQALLSHRAVAGWRLAFLALLAHYPGAYEYVGLVHVRGWAAPQVQMSETFLLDTLCFEGEMA
jgi:hypothetical protein